MKPLLILSLICSYFVSVAQNKPLCKTIVHANGVPGIGATVYVKNDTVIHKGLTIINEDGYFCVSYSNENDTLIYEGMAGTVSFLIADIQGDTIRLPQEPIIENQTIITRKPAIYLYPTQKTTINIQHDFKGEIGTTYPAYKNGWKVMAEPNGTLLNLDDNRKYEYLFWDGTYTFPAAHFDYKEGFVVAKENTTDFLWKQLAHIGLNEKEINDFVVYWLPQLERNDHNFIYFHINNDIDHSSILTVQPQPDSWIRLFMEFKPVPANYTIAEQQLPAIKRNGFTLVEWGGAVIENSETDFE